MRFVRYTETRWADEKKRVAKITLRPRLRNCSGAFYCTDLQVQANGVLTGYTPHTAEMLEYADIPPRHFNGVVRGNMTVIIPNTGETSAGLDCRIYPLQDTEAGSVSLSQGEGAQTAVFLDSAEADDELALLATTRQCLKNGAETPKNGFFQYTAAHDSKHQVHLGGGKSARVYFEYRETMNGVALK